MPGCSGHVCWHLEVLTGKRQGGGCLSERLPTGTPGLTWTEVPGGGTSGRALGHSLEGLGGLGGLGAQHTVPGLAIVFFRPICFE